MKLSRRSEYALLALVHMAKSPQGQRTPISSLAVQLGISPGFLEQIFLQLKRTGILSSSKGKGGGYWLARPSSTISMAEIVRALDGAIAPIDSVSRYFYRSTPIENDAALKAFFTEIRDYLAAKMESTMLASLSQTDKPERTATT